MTRASRQHLERAGAQVVDHLSGIWTSGQGMCLCPAHPDKTPSLSVRVGKRSLLFKCFAGCATADVLRAIRDLRYPVPRLTGPDLPDRPYPHAAMLARAREIWGRAVLIDGGLADEYLTCRHLAARPAALRFHPRTPLGRGRHVRFRPALVASVCEGAKLVSVQRLFLDPSGHGLAPDMPKPKLTLGRPLRGAVQLFPAADALGLAEGVETAMSASVLLGIPVWATLGAERLHQILIPDYVKQLVLLPDNDLSGKRAVPRAMEAYRLHDRRIDLLWPWNGLNDWNNVLAYLRRSGGKRGEEWVRDAA